MKALRRFHSRCAAPMRQTTCPSWPHAVFQHNPQPTSSHTFRIRLTSHTHAQVRVRADTRTDTRAHRHTHTTTSHTQPQATHTHTITHQRTHRVQALYVWSDVPRLHCPPSCAGSPYPRASRCVAPRLPRRLALWTWHPCPRTLPCQRRPRGCLSAASTHSEDPAPTPRHCTPHTANTLWRHPHVLQGCHHYGGCGGFLKAGFGMGVNPSAQEREGWHQGGYWRRVSCLRCMHCFQSIEQGAGICGDNHGAHGTHTTKHGHSTHVRCHGCCRHARQTFWKRHGTVTTRGAHTNGELPRIGFRAPQFGLLLLRLLNACCTPVSHAGYVVGWLL